MERREKSSDDAGKKPFHDKPRRSRSRSRSPRPASPNDNPGSNIYVANLPRGAVEEDLRTKFAKFGKISELKVVKDPYTKYRIYQGVKGFRICQIRFSR